MTEDNINDDLVNGKVSMGRYLLSKLHASDKLNDERHAHEREDITKQAIEYERRLSALNHEAEQLRLMQATYLPREVYEETLEGIRSEIKILTEWKNIQAGKNIIISLIASAGIALVISLLTRLL